MPGRGAKPEEPDAPGWYPDPWSATGEGERYFDGKRWGTTERPRARHSVAEPVAIGTGKRKRTGGGAKARFANARVWIIAVLIVAAGIGVTKLQSSNGSGDAPSPREQAVDAGVIPPSSAEEADAPLGKPSRVPAGSGQYEVIRHQPRDADRPVAFDPCRPVHYVVNRTGEPPDGEQLVAAAVARLREATGLDLVADGPTDETPSKERAPYQSDRYPKRWAPVLIAWSDEQAFPPLAGYIAGVGSAASATTDSGDFAYVTGQVVLDRQQLDPTALADRTEAKAIVLHELGHLVGLDHTADPTQLMFSEAQFSVQDYADGDLRGLAALGTQRCYPEL
jgi:hypothetical protein